jgi:hypothetical protein
VGRRGQRVVMESQCGEEVRELNDLSFASSGWKPERNSLGLRISRCLYSGSVMPACQQRRMPPSAHVFSMRMIGKDHDRVEQERPVNLAAALVLAQPSLSFARGAKALQIAPRRRRSPPRRCGASFGRVLPTRIRIRSRRRGVAFLLTINRSMIGSC